MPKIIQVTIGILIVALILILGFALFKPKPTGQIIANELYNNKTTTSSITTSSSTTSSSTTGPTTSKTTTSTSSTTTTSTTSSTTTTTSTITTTTIKPYIVSLDLENETVQINGSANIKNWTIHDEGNNYNYIFNIAISNLITLHTKHGIDNKTDIFWDYNISVWNNNGDTAYLSDNQGNLVDNLSCSSGKCSVKNKTTITTTSTTTTSSTTTTTTTSTTTTTLSNSTQQNIQIIELNLTGEYVILNGTGNLTNWTIEDEANHDYTFNIFLNKTLTLHTFNGTDNATHIFWNYSMSIWNDNGDTAFLKNNSGILIDSLNCTSDTCKK